MPAICCTNISIVRSGPSTFAAVHCPTCPDVSISVWNSVTEPGIISIRLLLWSMSTVYLCGKASVSIIIVKSIRDLFSKSCNGIILRISDIPKSELNGLFRK